MKTQRRAILIICLVALAVAPAMADITISVLPSLAPNAYGSPSYADWVSNAIYAIENGLSAYGTPGTPSYYQQDSSVSPSQMMVTGFPSWMGQADPGTVFGSAYANELGNRPSFGLEVNGNGQEISISELGFSATSNDPSDLLGFAYGTGSYDYSSSYVGVIFGTHGAPNTYITSGASNQLVDEIVGRGSGNADAAYCDPCTIAQEQAAIDALYPDFSGMSAFTGTYTMAEGSDVLASGSGTFTVPEPGSIVLFAAMVFGVAFFVRRRRAV